MKNSAATTEETVRGAYGSPPSKHSSYLYMRVAEHHCATVAALHPNTLCEKKGIFGIFSNTGSAALNRGAAHL